MIGECNQSGWRLVFVGDELGFLGWGSPGPGCLPCLGPKTAAVYGGSMRELRGYMVNFRPISAHIPPHFKTSQYSPVVFMLHSGRDDARRLSGV